MSSERDDLLGRVTAALAGVRNPGTGQDLLSAGHVKDLRADEGGVVRFQFILRPEDPGTLVREARAAVEAVPGVTRAKIDVKLPQAKPAAPGGSGAHGGGLHAVPGQQRQPPQRPLQPGSVPAPTPEPNLLPDVDHIFAVSSGKGGVGKSTVAANLAAALAAKGLKVGLLDADVYGPDIPLMFGERRRPRVTGTKGQERIAPLEAHGVKLMSLGFLLDEEQPAIMRGPIVTSLLRQFLEQVEWGELDFLVVDMPPGTGDAQLSLVQTINLDGAVMVTTPQEVSTGDVRRGVRMFERVKTRILGVVENMAGLVCPHCSGLVDVFGSGGGLRLAEDMHVPFLGSVPLDPAVREAGDTGQPTAIAAPESEAGRAFHEVVERLLVQVEEAVAARP